MAFLWALKEAREAGVSTEDFMKTWHMTKLDVTDDEAWEHNLRKGNKVTSPTMADKSKRLGWISPDPNNSTRPFAGDTQGNDTTEEEGLDTTQLKVPPRIPDPAPRQANKPVRSPRALPRRWKLQPPSYDRAQEFKTVDGNNCRFSQQTELKFIHHSDDDTMTSSDEEDHQKGLPSAADLQQLDADQQTELKTVYVNLDRRRRKETPSGPYEAVDDICMSKEDQTQLMDTVQHLQNEQEALKSKLREHDIHLTSLLDRQPSIRHTLRKKPNRGQEKIDFKMNQSKKNLQMVPEQGKGIDNGEKDYLYVQIEQLYSNYCRMYYPSNSIRWMLGMQHSRKLLHSKDDIDAVQDVFARRENSQGYWDIVSVQECLALQKENEELKTKVRRLEAELQGKRGTPNPSELKTKSPDKSMSTISLMPKLCNVRLSKLNSDGPAKPKANDALRKKKSSEPTTNSEDSVVAGCPVQDVPAMYSVNPVKMKFEWRIADYSKKREMERKGHRTKIESNPFYIHHNGYLAQVEVYLNGNSSGLNKCMSVFLRILKGTHDHLLYWPVRFCFDVTLVNQIEGRRGSFKGGSDECGGFEFRKPMSLQSNDSSNCWGFVKFIPHDMIYQRQFICNDSILLGISLKII